MAPHSNTLAWKTDGGAWQAVVHGVANSDTTEQLHFHFSLSCIGEGNGNPLQCSCLEKSQGRGSLVGCCLWGSTKLDTTEVTQQQQQLAFCFQRFCICRFNQLQMKKYFKKSRKFQKATLETAIYIAFSLYLQLFTQHFHQTYSYLHSIYLVVGTTYNLEMI